MPRTAPSLAENIGAESGSWGFNLFSVCQSLLGSVAEVYPNIPVTLHVFITSNIRYVTIPVRIT